MRNVLSFLAVVLMSIVLVITGFFAGLGYQDTDMQSVNVPACTVPQHLARDLSEQYPGMIIKFIPVTRDDQLIFLNVQVHPNTPENIRADIVNRYRSIGVDAVITTDATTTPNTQESPTRNVENGTTGD